MLLDHTDRIILDALQANARTTNADIARQVGMAPSAILDRIRKLEAKGVIRGYEARLDPHTLGYGLVAFVFVKTIERVGSGTTGDLLAQIPEVQELYHVAGEDCYLAKVRVADTEALSVLLRDRFGSIPTVQNTRTTIVLTTVKDHQQLNVLPGSDPGAEASSA